MSDALERRDKDIENRGFVPERSYTFFPDVEESEFFKTASLEDLSETCNQQPDMSARFVHELWRNKRLKEILELAKKGAIPDLTAKCPDLDSIQRVLIFGNDLIKSSAMMVHWGGVDPKECGTFICETLALAKMGTQEITTLNQLGEEDKQELKKAAAVIGEVMHNAIGTFKMNELLSNIMSDKLTAG